MVTVKSPNVSLKSADEPLEQYELNSGSSAAFKETLGLSTVTIAALGQISPLLVSVALISVPGAS